MKSSQLIDTHGKSWLLDDSLSDVERALDPDVFYRVSRQYLIRLSGIISLTRTLDGHYIAVKSIEEKIKVSRAKVKGLKALLAKGGAANA